MTETEAKRRVGILDLPIYTWQPLQKGKPFLARIGDLPMEFRAPTAFAAHKLAENWRREEVAKVARQTETARNRAEALKAAREAKNAPEGGAA